MSASDLRDASSGSLRWMSEEEVHFERTGGPSIAAHVDGERVAPLTLCPAFPVRSPLRAVELYAGFPAGEARPLGVVRNVQTWKTSQRVIVEEALARSHYRPRVSRILWIDDLDDRYRWRIQLQDGERMTIESRHEKEEAVSEVDDAHWLLDTTDGVRLVLPLDDLDDDDLQKLWNRL